MIQTATKMRWELKEERDSLKKELETLCLPKFDGREYDEVFDRRLTIVADIVAINTLLGEYDYEGKYSDEVIMRMYER